VNKNLVCEVLLSKHPKGKSVKPLAVTELEAPVQGPHPVIFDQIDGLLIHSLALRTQGTAGPSGLDVQGWRRLLSSFHKESIDLSENGASHWLAVIPLTEYSFTLHKSAFRDAVNVRYGWPLPHLPSHCTCGKKLPLWWASLNATRRHQGHHSRHPYRDLS